MPKLPKVPGLLPKHVQQAAFFLKVVNIHITALSSTKRVLAIAMCCCTTTHLCLLDCFPDLRGYCYALSVSKYPNHLEWTTNGLQQNPPRSRDALTSFCQVFKAAELACRAAHGPGPHRELAANTTPTVPASFLRHGSLPKGFNHSHQISYSVERYYMHGTFQYCSYLPQSKRYAKSPCSGYTVCCKSL